MSYGTGIGIFSGSDVLHPVVETIPSMDAIKSMINITALGSDRFFILTHPYLSLTNYLPAFPILTIINLQLTTFDQRERGFSLPKATSKTTKGK